MSKPANGDREADEHFEMLAEDEGPFRDLVEKASDIIMVLGADLTVRYVNSSIEALLGYRRESVVGTDLQRYLQLEEKAWLSRDFVAKHAGSPKHLTPVEVRMLHADGTSLCFEVSFTKLLDKPHSEGIAAYFHDITEERILRSALVDLSFHDSVTGLPNRVLFMDRLEQALARASRQREPVTVLFVDLDDFKDVNDSVGHEAGDSLLVAVGRRLKACVRPADTVARLGGDEFAVLLEFGTDPIDAIRVVERIMEASSAPIVFQGHRRFITVSIGMAHSDSGREHAEDLLWRADLAMYRAKERGKDRFELFEEAMSDVAHRRLKMEHDLKEAFDRGQLSLHYQPEVTLENGEIVGMEALLRWRDPEGGAVSPEEFVPLAEKNGMIVPIGRWILEEVCRQALVWQERYPEAPPLVSVNLSAREFRQPTLAQDVDAALRRTGLNPSSLMLEVTENFCINEAPHVVSTAQKLRSLGVRLVLDDFGLEGSSFSYLERLPMEILKIDRSLVGKLGRNGNGAERIVSAIIGFAHAMGIKTVAEGVETAQQLGELSDMGCELAQGFYFWEPMSGSDATALLERNRG